MKIYNNFSKEGFKILSNFFKDDKENILFVMEDLDHDGHDRFGYISNLWNLYVIYHQNNEYIMYTFHREEWYGDKSEEYTVMYNSPINTINQYNIFILYDNLSYIKDNNLINQIKLRYKNI